MTTLSQPKKDVQTVTPAGERLTPARIEGVKFRPATTHIDERGSITEVFDPAWQIDTDPLIYIYQFTIRPNVAKGWIVHHNQTDRIFLGFGEVKIVLFDNRAESPTYRTINEFYLSDYHRALITYPAGVYHALLNIGSRDAYLINSPTRPYNHADPDKYRLPLNNDLIPYRFDPGIKGW